MFKEYFAVALPDQVAKTVYSIIFISNFFQKFRGKYIDTKVLAKALTRFELEMYEKDNRGAEDYIAPPLGLAYEGDEDGNPVPRKFHDLLSELSRPELFIVKDEKVVSILDSDNINFDIFTQLEAGWLFKIAKEVSIEDFFENNKDNSIEYCKDTKEDIKRFDEGEPPSKGKDILPVYDKYCTVWNEFSNPHQ